MDFEPRKRSFFVFNKVFLVIVAVTVTAGIVFSVARATSDDRTVAHPSFFTALRQLVTSADKELVGETDDRINFLLLGIGGAGHDGPELTDTIILASVQPSTKRVGLLSIPRDLTIPLAGYGWRKINHVNAYGEEQSLGSGPTLAAETIGKTFEQPIQYWVKVDFSGFEAFLDAIGGIDVDVERAFTDLTFPIDDGLGTTTTLAFEAGLQHMNGAAALQYVRSRHGDNGEGSDFARAARQQRVLIAVKNKILSASTLLNPARISRILDTLSENIDTNLSTWEILRIANMADILDTNAVRTTVLDTRPGSPLYETTAGGAYVILPRNNDWSPLVRVAASIFDDGDILSAAAAPSRRNIRLEIQNGTESPGLATEMANRFALLGYDTPIVGNATKRNLVRTTIYDVSNGEHPTELAALQDYLGADVSQPAPVWLLSPDSTPTELTLSPSPSASDASIDFLIVLGSDMEGFER